MLQRIKENRNVVATPIIDNISEETFEYTQENDPSFFQVGGFTWSGHFTWINVQEKDLKDKSSSITPVNSPTMAGGLFAIDKNYFWEIGSYDEKMEGWGGENLEMSFRVGLKEKLNLILKITVMLLFLIFLDMAMRWST